MAELPAIPFSGDTLLSESEDVINTEKRFRDSGTNKDFDSIKEAVEKKASENGPAQGWDLYKSKLQEFQYADDDGIFRRKVSATNTEQFASNENTNRKYPSWFLFLPINILCQFVFKGDRPFFLFIAVLASISAISAYDPSSTFFAIFIIVTVQLLADAATEYYVIQSDERENDKKTMKWNDGTHVFESTRRADLKVGDLVKIDRNDPAPADVLIICSQSKKDIEEGFVETGKVSHHKPQITSMYLV